MSERANGRPIRVLRVIARLNVGGPALHVTYLARGLAERGYETTLVAGDVGEGEASMAFVAEHAGVEVVALPGLTRELSPVRDALAAVAARADHPQVRPDVVHTHTAKAGAVGRAAALLAGPRRPGRRAHVPRARPARLLRPRRARCCSARSRRSSRARPTG